MSFPVLRQRTTWHKSDEVKFFVCNYYRLERDYIPVTEFDTGGGIADVLVLRTDKQTIEVEVKTSKSDLDSELKSIDIIDSPAEFSPMFGTSSRKSYGSKYTKHKMYLQCARKPEAGIARFVPNMFYFAVPKELEEYAKSKIKPPYGLLVADQGLRTAMKAKKIHSFPIPDYRVMSILKRLSIECMVKMQDEFFAATRREVK